METLHQDGFAVAGVALGTDQEEALAFVHKGDITYPNVIDDGFAIGKEYGIRGVPHYVYLDRKGCIALEDNGMQGVGHLRAMLEGLNDEP